MEKLSELCDVFVVRFPELRFVPPARCLKVIGDVAFGFEFKRIRGQYKTFFVAYTLWTEIVGRGSDGCLFFWEIHDRRDLQIPFQLIKVDRELSRLLDGADYFVKPPLIGDISFGEFEEWVSKTQQDPLFRPFRWENAKLLRLALRTASYCRQRDAALEFLDQIIRRAGRDSSTVQYDCVFNGEKNWQALLRREIDLGLSGNPTIEKNRQLLKKKGLVVSDIVNS